RGDQGLCRAREGDLRARRRRAREAHVRRLAGREDRRRGRAEWCARAAARHRRALPRSEGEPAVRPSLRRARRHREPNRRRAHALQRGRPRLQLLHQELPDHALRGRLRLSAAEVLRGPGGGEEGAEGGLRHAAGDGPAGDPVEHRLARRRDPGGAGCAARDAVRAHPRPSVPERALARPGTGRRRHTGCRRRTKAHASRRREAGTVRELSGHEHRAATCWNPLGRLPVRLLLRTGGRHRRGGHDVTFVARGENLAALSARGLVVRLGSETLHLAPVRAVPDPAAAPRPELVLVCVKSYDTPAAAAALRRVVAPDTIVLSLQNGIENEDVLARGLGLPPLMVALTRIGVALVAPATIDYSGRGTILFGEPDGSESPRARRVAEALAAA